MGISILELVVSRLKAAGFPAEIAYPGQKFPVITDTVATVHIENVDRPKLQVTVEVDVISPASMGGAACELQALRAVETLRGIRASCVQEGCVYNGISQVYMVPVLATFTGYAEEERYVEGPGFWCSIGLTDYPHAIRFAAKEGEICQAEGTAGEKTPAVFSEGKQLWELEMEELIPAWAKPPHDQTEEFTLQFQTDFKREIFKRCRWTSISREYTREGLRRIRKGIALEREVEDIA